MIVAIDGPAGSGKSTIAKLIAEKLGYTFLNTGSFYRAIALSSIEEGINIYDREKVLTNARKHDLSFINGRLNLDGNDVEDKLHNPEIDKASSAISVDQDLRMYVNEVLRKATEGMDIVTEGRDTTTLLFPDADYKFYFDASAEVRAKRRLLEHPDGPGFEEVIAAIRKRDENDKNKAYGALKIADDAIYIDTTYLTINEVCERVLKVIEK